jgi:hypothetical protein
VAHDDDGNDNNAATHINNLHARARADVESKFCTPTGGFGSGWDLSWGSSYRAYVSSDGADATQACCGCGGGLRVGAKPKAKARAARQPTSPPVGKDGVGAVGADNKQAVAEAQQHHQHQQQFSAGTVHELDEGSFQDFLAASPTVVVMFYAPWCGACKNFKPVFEATAAARVAPGLLFGRVDATAHNTLQRR